MREGGREGGREGREGRNGRMKSQLYRPLVRVNLQESRLQACHSLFGITKHLDGLVFQLIHAHL